MSRRTQADGACLRLGLQRVILYLESRSVSKESFGKRAAVECSVLSLATSNFDCYRLNDN